MEPGADYFEHWNVLRDTLRMVLRFPPSEVKPFSYEVMYSAVYKCVCRHHSERLYSDLISEADAAFAEMAFDIHDSINLDQETLVGETALCHFDRALRQCEFALTCIVPVFTYLSRFYVEAKFQTDLRSTLNARFAATVVNPVYNRILATLQEAKSRPFAIDPAIAHSVVTRLHSLDPATADNGEHAELFARYVTSVAIRRPMRESELGAQIARDLRLQEELRGAGFNSGDSSRKRRFDEERSPS